MQLEDSLSYSQQPIIVIYLFFKYMQSKFSRSGSLRFISDALATIGCKNTSIKYTLLWDIMSYSPLKVSLRFGETFRLHIEGKIINQAKNQLGSAC
jgi:hypothetical protein